METQSFERLLATFSALVLILAGIGNLWIDRLLGGPAKAGDRDSHGAGRQGFRYFTNDIGERVESGCDRPGRRICIGPTPTETFRF